MATKLATARTAYLAQQRHVVDWLLALPPDIWKRSSRLSPWTVRELGFHVTDMTGVVVRALAAGRVKDKALTIAAYTSAWRDAAPEIAQRDREAAHGLTPGDVITNAARARADLLAALDATPGDPVVMARRGPLRLSDLMATRVNELVVHSLDLSASVPDVDPVVVDQGAVGISTRMLTGILAERVPGHSVELRVPPYAAVQCVAGPRHTRGTPPNVVEVEPVTWIEIATGRLSWTDAVDSGRVRASGDRADISEHLPVLS
ncbi:MAG TPA: sterol carrier family protein [Mycobacteriales bacterium]|nr:sterol carrier family protein [Mycobacteriales bacterium]